MDSDNKVEKLETRCYAGAKCINAEEVTKDGQTKKEGKLLDKDHYQKFGTFYCNLECKSHFLKMEFKADEVKSPKTIEEIKIGMQRLKEQARMKALKERADSMNPENKNE